MLDRMNFSTVAMAALVVAVLSGCGGGGDSGPLFPHRPGGQQMPETPPDRPVYSRVFDFSVTASDQEKITRAMSAAANSIPRPQPEGGATQSTNTADGVGAEVGYDRDGDIRFTVENRDSSGRTRWSIDSVSGDRLAGYKDRGAGVHLANDRPESLWVQVHTDDEPVEGRSSSRAVTVGDIADGVPILLSQGRRYSGTLNGQYGEFVCYVRCSATINFFSDRVEMTDGNLLFIPITRAPSADHLTYGSWLQASNNAANVTQYAFGSFADGNDPFEQGRLEPLTGTATYRGDARGVYFDSEDAEDSYFFDALVTFTANFGSGSELGTIGGRVHDFVTLTEFNDYRRSSSTGRTAVAGNPTLVLGSADIGSSNSGFFDGETSATYDGSAFSGQWGGRFYGNGDGSSPPGSVAGTFGAATADGSRVLQGAFGAGR